MSFESAGSRPVIVGNSKEPRTRHRHPVAFTANCPHRDSGMKESSLDVVKGWRKNEGGVQRLRQGELRRLCA